MRKQGLTELTQLGGIADNCPSPDLTQGLAAPCPFAARALFPRVPSSVHLGPVNLTFLSLNQQSFRAEHSYICTSDPSSELEYVLKKEAGCWDLELFQLQVLSGSCVPSQHEAPLGETKNTTNKQTNTNLSVALGRKKFQDMIRKTRCTNFTNNMLLPGASQTLTRPRVIRESC